VARGKRALAVLVGDSTAGRRGRLAAPTGSLFTEALNLSIPEPGGCAGGAEHSP